MPAMVYFSRLLLCNLIKMKAFFRSSWLSCKIIYALFGEGIYFTTTGMTLDKRFNVMETLAWRAICCLTLLLFGERKVTPRHRQMSVLIFHSILFYSAYVYFWKPHYNSCLFHFRGHMLCVISCYIPHLNNVMSMWVLFLLWQAAQMISACKWMFLANSKAIIKETMVLLS